MITLDIFGNPEPHSVYLVKPDGSILGCIDDIIDQTSGSLYIGINSQYNVTFDITHGDCDNDWYYNIQEGMYLFIDRIGMFKINQPTISYDGVKEKRSIQAYGIDSELEDKNVDISINMGTKTSMEYLVNYDDDEEEVLVNPYTGIPYDWIVIYNTYPEQLSELLDKVESGYFGTPDQQGEIVVTDSSLISELKTIFTMIPRLLNKIVYSDNPDGSKDSTLIEYVITEHDSTDYEIITSYTLTSLFTSRISALVTYYTKYRNQLSLIPLVLEGTGGAWSIGEVYGLSGGDYTLCNTKCQFEINETIYSFLTQSLAKAIECVVNFDIVNRKVNITPFEHIGSDTGIVISYDNIVNTLDITTDEDRLATRLFVSGGDDLSIKRVNFGLDWIEDLSYKINVLDENGNRVYVSDELATKYEEYLTHREEQREEYIELSKEYEEYSKKISDIKNRVPDDNLYNDWGTFSTDDLTNLLTVYKNLLATLKSLYKNDYGDIGLNIDGSINEDFIKTTWYWYDYEAYKTIISEIECALDVGPYYKDMDKWTSSQIAEYKEAITAWEYEWSLFGTVELEAKINTYKQNMDLLAEDSVIRKYSDSSTHTVAEMYQIKQWSELNDTEKAEYGSSSSAYKYDVYMEYYNHMIDAQDYLDDLLDELSDLEEGQKTTQESRAEIVESVIYENYFTIDECKILYRLFRDSTYHNENIIATSIDSISDRLDHMSELLEDARVQLSISSRPQLKFAVNSDNLLGLPEFKPLWKSFLPGNFILVQYKDNTYVKLRMIAYKFNPFLPSNHDIEIEFSNFQRSKSYYRDWASLLGNSGESGGSRSSGGYGSGSDAGYGESDDIDVTISNTMLAKLLNSETFGTRVTDVILDTIDVNSITARFAKFGGLSNGTTTIDGECIKTGAIISNNYNGTITTSSSGKSYGLDNTAGSILDLSNGRFNFGGGKVVWNGTSLNVNGDIVAHTLSTGSRTSSSTGTNGLYIDSSGNLYGGPSNDVIIYANGQFNFANGGFVYNGSALTIDGTGSGITIGSTSSYNTYITSSSLLFRYGSSNKQLMKLEYDATNSVASITLGNTDGYNSVIDNSGMLIRSGSATLASFSSAIKIYSGSIAVVDINSSSATFTGVIKASSGEIGTSATNKIMIGTDATYASIYSGMSSFSSTTSTGFYIGVDGFALGGGDFKVTNDGTMVATKATMTGDVSSSNGELKLQSGRFKMYDGGVEIFRIRPTVYENMSNVYNIDFQLATNRRYTTFSRGSTEMMRLGTDSDYYAWIWGNLYVSGTVTNSSDEKLKNIYKWNDVYDDVVQEISPIEFTWKDTKKDSKHHIGVGARNTKAVLDKYGIDNGIIVSEEEDHYSVAYNELIPMLLHSIQKDRKMILAIEKKLNELKKDWR